ncbi:MAG: pyridoxamine 5'-phosphate oxidase family protein [Symbiobacteriia bacterium]
MLPQELHEVLKHDGAAAIVTQGRTGPHLVGTWQSYIVVDGDTLVIPSGGYRETQQNVEAGSRVNLLVGREVNPPEGRHSGVGYRIEGTGSFVAAGPVFDSTKERFPWARAAFVVHVESYEKLI